MAIYNYFQLSSADGAEPIFDTPTDVAEAIEATVDGTAARQGA